VAGTYSPAEGAAEAWNFHKLADPSAATLLEILLPQKTCLGWSAAACHSLIEA